MITVKSVEIIDLDEPVDVFDIEVPVDHSFLISGIVAHNSAYCAAADGRRHKVGTNHPKPPYHYRCRTVQAPSFDGDVMGKRPYVRAFKPIGEIPKDERPDGMIGSVSAGTTWREWFERQPASFKQEWLGPSRYRLYRDGGYQIDRFVDPVGGKLTLDQLRARDSETFARLFG